MYQNNKITTQVGFKTTNTSISGIILANMLILEFNGNSWYLPEKKDKFAGSNMKLKFKLCNSVEQLLLYNVPQ